VGQEDHRNHPQLGCFEALHDAVNRPEWRVVDTVSLTFLADELAALSRP
jgi:hypothetical protein